MVLMERASCAWLSRQSGMLRPFGEILVVRERKSSAGEHFGQVAGKRFEAASPEIAQARKCLTRRGISLAVGRAYTGFNLTFFWQGIRSNERRDLKIRGAMPLFSQKTFCKSSNGPILSNFRKSSKIASFIAKFLGKLVEEKHQETLQATKR